MHAYVIIILVVVAVLVEWIRVIQLMTIVTVFC